MKTLVLYIICLGIWFSCPAKMKGLTPEKFISILQRKRVDTIVVMEVGCGFCSIGGRHTYVYWLSSGKGYTIRFTSTYRKRIDYYLKSNPLNGTFDMSFTLPYLDSLAREKIIPPSYPPDDDGVRIIKLFISSEKTEYRITNTEKQTNNTSLKALFIDRFSSFLNGIGFKD